MYKFQKAIVVGILALSFFMGACSQDESMNDIMDNPELNAPTTNDDQNNDDDPFAE